jgi:hypothetical protein
MCYYNTIKSKEDKKMKKLFIYQVKPGFEFRGDSAWGEAWKAAKEVAMETHQGIFRTVVKGDEERHEYFAKGKMFVNIRFYKEGDLYIY